MSNLHNTTQGMSKAPSTHLVTSIDLSSISPCRTIALVDDFYLCQNNNANCKHAFSYGTSNLCRSPDKKEYSR